MKTININLIGELGKAPKYNRSVIKRDNIDAATKITLIIFIVGIFLAFAVSFGLWFVTNNLSTKHKPQLEKLKQEHLSLQKEQARLSVYRKSLKEELELAEFKLLARNQISNNFIPWSNILKDLANKVPRNMIILDIAKTSSNFNSGNSNTLKISGFVPVPEGKNSETTPFTSVSFLILNINEDRNSLLNNAEIKRIEYKSDQNIYEFEIKTNVYTQAYKKQLTDSHEKKQGNNNE